LGEHGRTVAIITARWGSKRFPGKALADLWGKPILQHIVDAARKAQYVDDVVVATSVNSKPIMDYCAENNIKCVAGDEEDVLSRIDAAARVHGAETIVYLWGDAPLITSDQIDCAIKAYYGGDYIYLGSRFGVVAVMNYRIIPHYLFEPLTIDTPEDLEGIRELYETIT
jgi:spore coat polysaccharide biosynthesis protein SpsF